MNITLSLLGQMITFAIFVWFTMKFVWPPLTKALNERQKKIADGLHAAGESQKKLEVAEKEAARLLKEAKAKSAELLDEARQRGNQIIDEHKQKAVKEGDRIVELAGVEIKQEQMQAKDELLKEVSSLSIEIAEKLTQAQVSEADHAHLIGQLISQVEQPKE